MTSGNVTPGAHITLDPCGKEECPVCNPIPAALDALECYKSACRSGVEEAADEERVKAFEAMRLALEAAKGVEPKLTKPARVHHTEFAAGLPERMVIECAQRHYEWSREPSDPTKLVQVWRERVEGYRNSGVDECYPMAREVEKCADELAAALARVGGAA